MSEQQLFTPEEVQIIVQEKLDAMQQDETDDRYDNELIKYYRKISKNQSIDDIVEYIKGFKWSDRQQKSLISYARVVLGDSLSTTYFRNSNDYKMFYDDKSMIDIDMAIGMTIYDMTAEYIKVIDMVNYHAGIESRKSIGAMLLKQMRTQRHEFEHGENIREKNTGFTDKIKSKLGFGE